MINLKPPHITGATEAEQLAQISSYLRGLVQELNWALSSLDSSTLKEDVSGIKKEMEHIKASVDSVNRKVRSHISEGGG